MGPLFQIIGYYIIYNIYILGYIETNIFSKLTKIHILLLKFNLLPIIPLDGGKLINIMLNKILPYNLSNKITIYISYISLAFNLIIKTNRIIKLMLILILIKLIKEHKESNYRFNKFILERKIYNYKLNKIIRVKNIKSFYRGKTHKILINNKEYTEKEYLTNTQQV